MRASPFTSHCAHTAGSRPVGVQMVGKWHLGYPAQSLTQTERDRIVAAGVSGWRTVKGAVLTEYRAIQAHVVRGHSGRGCGNGL